MLFLSVRSGKNDDDVFAAATMLMGHRAANADCRSADGACACNNGDKGAWSNARAVGRAVRGVPPAVPHVTNLMKLLGAPRSFRGPFRVLLCLQGISFCEKEKPHI